MRPSKRQIRLDTVERLFCVEGFHATVIDRVIAEARAGALNRDAVPRTPRTVVSAPRADTPEVAS